MKAIALAIDMCETKLRRLMIRMIPSGRFTATVLFVALTFPLVTSGQRSEAKILEYQWSSQPLTAGVGGKVQMQLSVKDGFKVAKNPPPKFQVNSDASFNVAVTQGFLEDSPGKDADYFGGFKPLELKVVPEKSLKSGKHLLEAKLTYFYCSEREKYCSRSIENVKVPLEVAAVK